MSSSAMSNNADSASQDAISHDLTRHSQSSNGLGALLAEFGAHLFSMPDVDGGAVNLVNEANDALITAHLKLPSEFSGVQNGYKGFQYHFDQPDINVEVFRSGAAEIVCMANLAKFAEITRIRFERWKMCSLVVFPLVVVQDDGAVHTIGTASVFSQRCLFEPGVAEQIGTIANRYSAQIQILWNQHQRIERDKIAEAMSDHVQQFFACVTEMNSLTTVSGVYGLITKEFIQHFGFDAVSILLADGDGLSIVQTAFSEPFQYLSGRFGDYAREVKYSFNVGDGQSGFVYTQNQHFHIEDVAKILHMPMSEKDRYFVEILETIRTLLIVPIRLKKEVIGTMTLVTLSTPRPLSETDLNMIELLASFSSTAIRNAKAHELVAQKNSEIELLNQDLQIQMVMLDNLARKDHLTKLNNFGSFEEELKRRTSEYARSGEGNSLAAILFDVDNFKFFNDAHGHLAGNKILQEVGTRILKCAREMDFVARYGGEEFIMLLPQCDLADASIIAERIRGKISDEDFVVGGQSYRISISGGCAQFLPNESSHDFIYRVDAALYCAKRNGRNRIEQAPALLILP